MSTEAATLEELFEKVKYLIKVRIESLKEIGRKKDAEDLQQKEIIFIEE